MSHDTPVPKSEQLEWDSLIGAALHVTAARRVPVALGVPILTESDIG